MGVYQTIHYNVIPPLFVVTFTIFVQVISLNFSGQPLSFDNYFNGFTGNKFSWSVVLYYILWSVIWLWIPGKMHRGPKSPEGEIPEYRDNGPEYYFSTIFAFLFLEYISGDLSQQVYKNFPQILGTLNIVALVFCLYLYWNSSAKEDKDLPKMYLFYRGRDLHPKFLGVQVKQLTNCRIGVVLWQVLILAFFIASYKESRHFHFPSFVTLLIQTVYLAKCNIWERLYFHTLDIMYDRAGYYLCWGCIVWIPCFLTSTSYYFVKYPPLMSDIQAGFCALIGLIVILVQTRVDLEKFTFRLRNGDCLIWGKKPTFIIAKMKDPSTGKEISRKLLTSGFWGTARHLNYTCEIFIATLLALPGYHHGIPPFSYAIFLAILLSHRLYRDEKKCSAQYGKYWEEYCRTVPYRLIPYIF